MFAYGCCGETWPRLEEATLDGLDPGGFCWAKGSGVEEVDEIRDALGLICAVALIDWDALGLLVSIVNSVV